MATDPKYLQAFSCFNDLSKEQLQRVAQITDAICYPPGYTLFEEGQAGESLFFLVKGEVEVLYNIGEDGPVHVDTVSGEEAVGCAALVEPFEYTATERSLTEIEVLVVNTAKLRDLMAEDCQLGFRLQHQLLRVLMDRITGLRLLAPG